MNVSELIEKLKSIEEVHENSNIVIEIDDGNAFPLDADIEYIDSDDENVVYFGGSEK